MISTSRPTFLRRGALAAIAALALVAGALISVPTAASAAETGSITGTAFFGAALQASGTVYLHAHGEATTIGSSPVSNGSFGFTVLADGQYDLEFDDATHNGAVSPSQWYRTGNAVAEVQGDATAITVSGGGATSVSINRTIGGTVAGTIVDSDGVAITSARVTLYNSADNEVASDIFTTSAFSIAGLKTDTYKLKITPPSGIDAVEWYNNATSQADATGIPVTRESTANTGAIALDYSQAVGTFSGTIRDTVTLAAVPSVTLELRNQSDVVVATETTDSVGKYTFDHLADGQYTLTATPAAGSGFKQKVLDTEIQMPDGNVPTDYYIEAISLIQGFVRQDFATFDALGGRTVELYAAPDYSTVVKTTMTISTGDYKGYYFFRGVDAGTYKIKIVGSSGYVTRWVGNTSTSAGALEIVFGGEGATRNNLQTMLPLSSYIYGTFTAATGAPTDFSPVSAVFSQNGVVVSSGPAHATGEWSSGTLEPGTYTVSFVATSGFTNATLAEATGSETSEVTVSGGSTIINNVTLYGAFSSTSTATITGQAAVGETLTAASAAWTPAADFDFVWSRDGEFQSIGDTYLVTELDEGHTVSVATIGLREGYTQTSVDGASVNVIDSNVATVSGSITAAVGSPTLEPTDVTVYVEDSAENNFSSPVDADGHWSITGLEAGDYTIYYSAPSAHRSVYYSEDDAEGSAVSGTRISLALGANTAPSQVLYGKYSSAFNPIILGDPIVGAELTVSIPAWTPTTGYSFEWINDDNDVVSTTATYVVEPEELGGGIRVLITPTKQGYSTLGSSRISPAAQIVDVFTSKPVPTISGEPKAGQVLTAFVPAWTPAAEQYGYLWFRNGVAVSGALSPDNTYVVKPEDAGADISVGALGFRTGFKAEGVYSDAVRIAGNEFLTTPTPTISGTPKVGSKLTASVSAWTPAATSSAFQWYRAGQPIAGATGATYTLVEADSGKKLSVRVTGTLATYETTTVSSAELAIAKAIFSKAPVPTISGTKAVGATLKAVTGTWTPAASFTYQWSRGGVAITGATANTYKVVAADAGQKIAVQVTGARLGFETLSKSSAQSTVALQKLTKTPKPTISGTAKKGKTLKVKAGTWAPATVALTYQWERNGKKIAKATKASYKLTSKDKGKKITVVVTGKKAGFTTVAKESSAKKVKK